MPLGRLHQRPLGSGGCAGRAAADKRVNELEIREKHLKRLLKNQNAAALGVASQTAGPRAHSMQHTHRH
eukprot:581427-Alexandrium_andersonii.AAC.1